MQRSSYPGSGLKSYVCTMIAVVTLLISASGGEAHERTSDRQPVLEVETWSTSIEKHSLHGQLDSITVEKWSKPASEEAGRGRLRSNHDESLLRLVQSECTGKPGEMGPRDGGCGGGGGGIGAGAAVGVGVDLGMAAGVATKIAYGVSLALLVTLAAGGSRWLWNSINDWKPSLFTGTEDVDVVECSVFGPRVARPGNEIMIGVFLNLAEHRNRASFLAKAMDSSAKLRAKCSEIAIKRGAAVEISCAVNTLCVDEPVQSIVWQGRLASCQFLVTVPEGTGGRSFFAVVRVSVDGSLIGRVKFRISSDPDAVGKNVGFGNLRRYEKPFVSYSTRDRKEVLKRVQMLQIMKSNFFMDLLSLDPGDRWKKKLYKHIDRCDLFLLFWSQAAKDSPWVLQEAEYALKRQQGNPNSEPDIVPVILEQEVLPPPSLAQLNFNDRIHYLISQMDRAEISTR